MFEPLCAEPRLSHYTLWDRIIGLPSAVRARVLALGARVVLAVQALGARVGIRSRSVTTVWGD